MTAPTVDDPDWDWIPVELGAELAEGDIVLWAVGYQFEVADITAEDNGNNGTVYTFINDDTTVQVQVHHPADTAPAPASDYDGSQYLVTPHPLVGSTFRNVGDDSMWVFTASKAYRCWKAGTRYPVGTVLTRVQIDGTMVAT